MYQIIAEDGRAKSAHMETVHGNIETPVFMNVGTVAAIKGAVSTVDLKQIGQFRTSAYCDEIVIKGKLDSLPSVIARKEKGEKVKSGEIVLVQKAAVHAGVDFDKMEPEDLRLSGDTLFVALPAAEILQIDMDRTKQDVFLQKGKWDGDQVEELYGPAEKKLIQDALDGGVLTKAYANAKEYIEDFFRPFGYVCVINQKQPQQ